MSLTAPATGQPDPMVLSTLTDDVVANAFWGSGSGTSSATATANLAVFVPVRLSQRRTYTKAWWVNGATASGNIDVGVYTLSGTTLTRVAASTAEAQGTVSTLQVAASFTPTTIGPGLYYLALSATSATATLWRCSLATNHLNRLTGALQAGTSSPLPSTCTDAAVTATTVALFGLSESAAI